MNRQKWADVLGSATLSALLGAALSMQLCGALSLTPAFAPALLASALAALVGSLACLGKKGFVWAALSGVALLFLALRVDPSLNAALSALSASFRALPAGEMVSLSAYAPTIARVAGVLLTLLVLWLSRMSGGVYPALTLSLVILIGDSLVEQRVHPVYAGLSVLALIMMFAHARDERVPYLRALPAALVAALLAVWLMPGAGATWQPLADAAQKARDLFQDYFFFTEPRVTYSISQDGFQSMGEQLGGPAEPSTKRIMSVETPETLFLRGSVKRTYTGYSWTENAVNSRYLFIDPVRKGTRDAVFDAGRVPLGTAFSSVTCNVTMLSQGISTLFVPHRLAQLGIPLDLVTYFSTSGEVFITRDVEPGDAYAATADLQTGSRADLRALVARASGQGDAQLADVTRAYTQLPQTLERGVYDLVAAIVAGHDAPIDRALAIQDALMAGYSYSLDVPYPTQGRDFVSEFLLDTKTGYCAYFASAMAVMGRIAGLPTRYVEGYLVPARAGGTTLVLGKNAHAWVEVYFEGVGWVTFNPTPGSGDTYEPERGGQGDGADGQNGAGSQPASGSDDAQASPSPEPTPGASASPSPAPSATPDEGQADETGDGEETPEGGEPTEGETSEQPEPTPEPQPDAMDEPEPPDADGAAEPPNNAWLWWLLLPLLIAGATGGVLLRLRRADPRSLAPQAADDQERLMIWYRALLLLLEQQGQSPAAEETPPAFAARLYESGLAGEAFVDVADQVYACRYGARPLQKGALKRAAVAYDKLAAQLRPLEKARWLFRRILHGLGDPRRIP